MIEYLKRVTNMRPPKLAKGTMSGIAAMLFIGAITVFLVYNETYPFSLLLNPDAPPFVLILIPIGAAIITFVVIIDNPEYFSVKGRKRDYIVRLILFLIVFFAFYLLMTAILN